MFSVMPLPVFRDDNSASPSAHRPSVSSPLSSSPVRQSSPPLARRDPNARMREIQSSPIKASSSASPKFRFATRTARPNPAVQKREAAQESRRKLFLKNVRQRADDRQWQRRGGDNELLKLEWFSLNKDLQQAKNADLEGLVFDSDIEDAARLREESLPAQRSDDPNDMMLDALEQEQEAEIEYFMSSNPTHEQSTDGIRTKDPSHWSDDEDYDALFMDLLSQEQGQAAPASSGEMDLS